MSARLPFLNLIAAAAVVTGAAMLAGCGGGGSGGGSSLPSTFSGSVNLVNGDGFYMPEEGESPLPTAIQLDSDGNFEVVSPDSFSIDGLEVTLSSLGIISTQSVGLQLPGAGSEFDYEEKYRWKGDSEWDTDYYTVTWDSGTVLVGGTSVPAIVAEIDYDGWFID